MITSASFPPALIKNSITRLTPLLSRARNWNILLANVISRDYWLVNTKWESLRRCNEARLPVVHEDIRFPKLVRRNSKILHSAVLGLVPLKVVVCPLLHTLKLKELEKIIFRISFIWCYISQISWIFLKFYENKIPLMKPLIWKF